MKNTLTALSVACSAMAFGQHANIQSMFMQLENLEPYYSSFMEEYTYDINTDVNRSFFINLQSTASVMDTGEFAIGIMGGMGVKFPHLVTDPEHLLYNDRNLQFDEYVPTAFGPERSANLTFTFINPHTDAPAVNPTTGDIIQFEMETPNGLGSVFAVAPSAALTLGYGIGYGTEVRGYITPKFGAAAAAVSSDISISNDFAYGASVKHEISTWIPALQSRGWHLSADVAYSALTANINGGSAFGFSDFSTDMSDTYEASVTNNLEGFEYSLSTYGARIFASKTFSWIEITAFAGWMNNTYSMKTTGSVDATLVDKSGSNPDTHLKLDHLIDFSNSNASMLYGGSFVFGRGWFRYTLSYTYAQTNFASTGFNIYF